MRTTYMAKPDKVNRKWYVIDATNISLGRLTSVTATILRGKNKPTYTPNVDTGDNVIIVNAAKVKLTGRKLDEKVYYHPTGYIGHLKSITAGDLLKKDPCKLVHHSLKGMLPHNTLGHHEILKCHIYAGAKHDNAAQKPEKLNIDKLI